MPKIKKDGKDFAVIKRTVEEYIPTEEIEEKIASVEAMIVATQATLDDYKAKKKALEDYLK